MARSKSPMVSCKGSSMHVRNGTSVNRTAGHPHTPSLSGKSCLTVKTASTLASQSDDTDGNDGEDGSAIEGRTSSDDPDGRALSRAVRSSQENTRKHVAGPKTQNYITGEMKDESIITVDSEDDDYADVEDVSDSDESLAETGEDSILRFAEKDLITEFEKVEQSHSAHTMTNDLNDLGLRDDDTLAGLRGAQGNGNHNDEYDWGVNMNEDPFGGLLATEPGYNDMLQDAELAIWRMPQMERDDKDTTGIATKRVRFEETRRSRSPSTSSSENAGDDFPDLFAQVDDPLVRQRMARADAEAGQSLFDDGLDAESVYDFDGDEEKAAFAMDENTSSESYESSDDSEDDGDSTDEETAEEQIARMHATKKALGKSPSDTPSTPAPSKRRYPKVIPSGTPRPSTPGSRRGPVEGTFALDPTRASMSANATGTKIEVRPPSRPLEKDKDFWERAKTVNNSRNGSPQNAILTIPSPGADNLPPRPFTAQSTLGSMFNGNLDIIRNNDVTGIATDLLPNVLATQKSFFTTAATEDSDTDRPDVDMRDFIEIDDLSSDTEDLPSACITSPTDSDVFASFTSDNETTPGFGNGLLDHFDQRRGIVGSFRRNQHQAKHFSSLASHPATRASASEYNALQKGRRGAGNSPMTPARKKRNSQDLTLTASGVKKNVSSPLASRRPRSRGNSIGGAKHTGLYSTLASSPFD